MPAKAGEQHNWTEKDVELVRNMLEAGRTVNEMADILKVSQSAIHGTIHRFGLFIKDGLPTRPKLQDDGAYCHIELEAYLDEAISRGIRDQDIALHLRVPLHRASYLTGSGLERMRSKAAQKRLLVEAEALLRTRMEPQQ